MPPGAAQALSPAPVVCVSHGFQTNYERGFCNGLAAQGVAVTLVSSNRTDTARLNPAVRAVNLRGSQSTSRPRWQKAVNMVRYRLVLLAYVLFRRRSTVHVIGLLAPPVWCGLVEGLWFRLVAHRYALTVHDVLPHEAHTDWNRRVFRWAYRLPQALVVHTERMKATLVADFGADARRVVVMEHGIEPGAPVIDAEPPTATAPPLLLAFGIVVPRKGIDVLLRALEDVGFDFRLVIAGPCPDADYHALLAQRIAGHPHQARIEWIDRYVEEPVMEDLFRRASLLALPYRYIDQSGVLFQALRFGVPVLATRVGQFERYVTEELGELARPDDAADLRAALQRWVARRGGLSRERIRAIGKAYEWPTTVQVLAAAYR